MVYISDLPNHNFGHKEPKNANQNTNYRNKIMLKSLPTFGTEPVVKVVTLHEHRNYQ